MNVRCPGCQTIFRVDPDKVPAGGINTRCSRCATVFRVDPEGSDARAASRPAAALAASVPAGVQPRGEAVTTPPARASALRPPAQEPRAQPAPAARRASFRNQDPEARAQRIARALVSDIVAYNKEKLSESRSAGSLRNDFREEIRKSWEEYVEQVGLELARRAPYFRDALNDLLAQGQKVF